MTERKPTRKIRLSQRPIFKNEKQRNAAALVASAIVFVLTLTLALALSSFADSGNELLQVGDIAPRDILAPSAQSYTSAILTESRRQMASDSVNNVYFPPNPDIAREQIALLQDVIARIDEIRANEDLSDSDKRQELASLGIIELSPEEADPILNMDENTWSSVSTEATTVLERVMREPIREVDVNSVRDGLAMQVSVRFNATNAAVVTGLARDLVRPNRLLNQAATDDARQAAVAAVEPEVRSYEQGQFVVEGGTRITALDIEALDALGLLVSPDLRLQQVAQALLASLLAAATVSLYLTRQHPDLWSQFRLLWLLEGLFLIAVVSFALFSSDGAAQYLFPYAVLALLFVGLVGTEFAIFSTVLFALLAGIMANNALEVTALTGFGGVIGALSLKGTDRLNRYFFVGLVLACVNVVVVVIFSLGVNALNAGVFVRLISYGLLNGLFAAMAALVGLYLITLIFNMPTSIKLVELSQPSSPLLQRLLREAPGTYQHSLQVANLAEQAASAMGANAELVRVAALYHDIGKVLNPAFFVENQVDGSNPHDLLHDPFRSAAIIISHVPDGDRLARQFRLPARIRDFIWEHHGTTKVSYFLSKALSEAESSEQVDVDLFTYPGPKPQTRETAILMLADSSESIVRARKPANKQEISTIIREIVESRIADGQLDESNLTLKDIEQIRTIFVEMLQGVFHPRINYPGTLSRLRTEERAGIPTIVADRVEKDAAPETVVSLQKVPSASEQTLITDDDAPLADVPPLRRTRSNGVETSEMPALKEPEGERDDVSG